MVDVIDLLELLLGDGGCQVPREINFLANLLKCLQSLVLAGCTRIWRHRTRSYVVELSFRSTSVLVCVDSHSQKSCTQSNNTMEKTF